MHYLIKVEVQFKESVLEPQGQAILLMLKDHNEIVKNDISSIRVGKTIGAIKCIIA